MLGAAELVLIVGFGLWGGALADAVDRRKMVLLCEAAMCALTGLLLVNALLPDPQIWPLYLVVGLVAAADAAVARGAHPTDRAARPAGSGSGALVIPVERRSHPRAGDRWRARCNRAARRRVWDRPRHLPRLPRGARTHACGAAGADAERPSIAGIVDGLRYACRRQELVGTYVVDMAAMFFAMPIALLPFLADELNAPWALGMLYSAGAVGSLLATLSSGWTSRVRRQCAARAVLPRCRRRSRHGERSVPYDDVEPDDPGSISGTPGRN